MQRKIYTSAKTNEFLQIIRQHAHTAHAARVDVIRAMTTIKHKSIETRKTPSQIKTSAIQKMSHAALGQLPIQNAIRQVIKKRARKDADAYPFTGFVLL